MMITSTMSSLTSGAGSGLATQVLAPTKPELSVGPHSSEHHNLCCPTCSLSPEPTASSSIPATQLADSRMRTTEWFGYLVPHGKPPTTSTALLRAPFPLSDSTTAMACDSTRHGYRRPTRSSSRTNLIYQSRSRTSTSSFLCHMAPSARASSSPSQHGNGEPNHCNHARATTMASDGKLAPKTHRQTASCREHMVTSWSLSYAQASNSTLVAFDRTQQYLHGNQDKPASSASSDPWQSGHDPWATWFNQHPQEGKVPAAPSAADRLQQAEERIKADLHATLQKQIDAQWRTWDEDQDMDTEDTSRFESRFRQLETNVAELQRQNTKFEHWFTEAAEANQATNMQIESVAKQVHSHQAELTTLNKNVNEHNAELRREMSNGFSNIEALLSKKHRAE